jgi:4-aminobutyrate aminotransferase-like enzyme
VYEREDMSERSHWLGQVLLEHLTSAFDDHPLVGDVRGRGLMAAIELVSDRETKEPLVTARHVSNAAIANGLLVYPGGHHGNVIGFLPPLVATPDQLGRAVEVLADSIEQAAV